MDIDFRPMLLGRDLRPAARSKEVAQLVQDQETFDQLFILVLHHERLLLMRAADAVQKVTLQHPEFLLPHKDQLFSLLKGGLKKELKWHLALLITRVPLDDFEVEDVWTDLSYWALNPNESKIVRVNALQGLYELTRKNRTRTDALVTIMKNLEHTNIPSLQARIRKLSKLM